MLKIDKNQGGSLDFKDGGDPIRRIGTFEIGGIVGAILKSLEGRDAYKRIQLELIRTNGKYTGFEYINLRLSTLNQIEALLAKTIGCQLVPKTVGKSKPSIYISGNIPQHLDVDEGRLDIISRGFLVPLRLEGFSFLLDGEDHALSSGGIYIFDHSLPHSLIMRSYSEWLKAGGLPYIAVVGSIMRMKNE